LDGAAPLKEGLLKTIAYFEEAIAGAQYHRFPCGLLNQNKPPANFSVLVFQRLLVGEIVNFLAQMRFYF